ncbi:MAG TPA: PIN domain-containing protein [Acidimicrobiales bacterium]|nr:PIN domain-containing protein [Acidimicrobiales bacterium]
MLRVVFDTTVLCEDFLLRRPAATRLFAAAAAGSACVHLSPVVLAETERRYLEDLRSAAGSLTTKLKSLGQFGVTVTHDLDLEQRRASEDYLAFLEEILRRPGVSREHWPDISHEALVDRDMRMLPPFRKGREGTTGYRDTLIWLGTVDIARRHPGDDVVLVSANASPDSSPANLG